MIRPRPLYFVLKRYVYIAALLFYKRFTIHQAKNVPLKGPVIFVPNHQNAFMDAIMVAVTTPRKPWFLTRASIFGSAMARYWLSSLRMIPIYRIRDGLQNVRKNDETMEICLDLLKNNETILIFAEGNHNRQWMLRPLQKGLSRISFSYESMNNFTGGLKIIPVGLQYESHKQFRSDLLITYGTPICVSDYKDIYYSDPLKATTQLIEDVRKGLSAIIVDIPQTMDYDTAKLAIQQRPCRENNLVERLKSDKAFVLKNDFSVENKSHSSSILLRLVGFPVFVYGAINHLFIYLIIKYLLKKVIKDDHWTSSIKFAGMIIVSPIFYALQSWLLWQFVPDWACIISYIVSLPFAAAIAGDYWYKYLKYSRIS